MNRLKYEKVKHNRSYIETLNRYFHKRVLSRLSSRFHCNHIIDKTILEINLTNACNLKCANCCSSCPQAPNTEYISIKQIRKFLKESEEINWEWKLIKLYGGEPTMHPDFFKVLEVLEKYLQRHPKTKTLMITNGVSVETRDILTKTPKWLNISNSTLEGMKKKFHFFESYNIAPIDLKKYKNADFSKGCWRVENCGLSLSKHGYHSCTPGYHVDRVFGFDIGIKKLKEVNNKSLRKQMETMCKFCGLYKEPKHLVKTQSTSKSWAKAYSEYSKKLPKLREY